MAKTRERIAEMRLLGDRELLERLAESRRELFNMRFQLATGQLDNSARLNEVRRDIARLVDVRARARDRGRRSARRR